MADETNATAEAKPRTHFNRIAEYITRDSFGTGDRAALRRNDRGHVIGQPAFFRLMAFLGIDTKEYEAPAWGAIVQAIAQTADHGHSIPSGIALAASGLSEARFSRLMAASGDALLDQVGIIARYLAAKQTPINWTDLAELLLADHHGWQDSADRLRFRIAQGFYRELNKMDQRASA